MLKIENLSAGILRHISLTVAEGESVAIIGQSGSGKTTLLNCIAGYLPYQGEIFIDQQSMNQRPAWQRPCRYLNQRLYLFPHKTVGGNLSIMNNKISRQQQLALLQQLNIDHLIDLLPSQISGGEQQRAALARALIETPKLLLLDEPFSSLDWHTRKHLWQQLTNFTTAHRITTLLVTHEPREAEFLAQRQIQIAQGALLTD